jgi:hypothetical protein
MLPFFDQDIVINIAKSDYPLNHCQTICRETPKNLALYFAGVDYSQLFTTEINPQ